MEHNLKPYYVVVDLYNLSYISKKNTFVSLEDAAKFESEEEADKFVKSFEEKFDYAIYKVNPVIRLERVYKKSSSLLNYPEGVR